MQNEKVFKKDTFIESVLRNSDAWIGTKQNDATTNEFVYDIKTNRIIRKEIDVPEALQKLFLEILSNATDASRDSVVQKIPASVEIEFFEKGFEIKNFGLPLELRGKFGGVELKKDRIHLNPEILFSDERTSSNYVDEGEVRQGAGKNGVGAKIVNVYSKKFSVKVYDESRDMKGVFTWDDFSRKKEGEGFTLKLSDESKYKYFKDEGTWDVPDKYKGKPVKGKSYVAIRSEIDFSRFSKINGKPFAYLTDDCIKLFFNFALQSCMSLRIPLKITINLDEGGTGTVFNFQCKKLTEYTHLLWGKESTEIYNIYKHKDTKTSTQTTQEINSLTQKQMKDVGNELIVDRSNVHFIIVGDNVDVTDTKNYSMSIANSLVTKGGGKHVDSFYSALEEIIREKMKLPNKIPMDMLKSNIPTFIVSRVDNPMYDGNKKEILKSPAQKIQLAPSFWNAFKSSGVFQKLMDLITKPPTLKDAKKKAHTMKTDSKAIDAVNFTNPKRNVLYLVEGDSAANYPNIRSKFEKTKDYTGIIPLKGKVVNVNNDIGGKDTTNSEIQKINEFLGLRKDIDYTKQENRDTLRYGSVIILTDADDDGKHILSLLLNNFFKWKGLVESGIIKYLMTPVIRIQKGNQIVQRFYDEEKFNVWKERISRTELNSLKIKYFKGLGTSVEADVVDDITWAPIITCDASENTKTTLSLAFGKSTEIRKEWLYDSTAAPMQIYKEKMLVDEKDFTSKNLRRYVDNIINRDLYNYSLANITRAIPSNKDGLKEVQRKIVYGMIKKWLSSRTSITKEEKLTTFSSYVSQETKYHHGETSLHEAAIKLAQNFVGKNNLNILFPDGAYGSRDDAGDDSAAARYLNIRPETWTVHGFNTDLISLVDRVSIEGEDAETEWIPCDIPLHVVNGCNGIATGWSTKILSYNPLDVIDYMTAKIKNGRGGGVQFIPWYKGFNGSITQEGTKVTIKGNFEYDPDRKVIKITEIPIGIKTKDFFKHIYMFDANYKPPTEKEINSSKTKKESDAKKKELSKAQKIASKPFTYKSISKTSDKDYDVYCELRGVIVQPDVQIDHKLLGLISEERTSNMVLIDQNLKAKKYDTVEEIINDYMEYMLKIYSDLKKSRIKALESKIEKLDHRIKIIELVKSKELDIYWAMDKIESFLTGKNIKFDVYKTISVTEFSKDNTPKMKKELEDLREKLSELIKTKSSDEWLNRLVNLRKVIVAFYKEREDEKKSLTKKATSSSK